MRNLVLHARWNLIVVGAFLFGIIAPVLPAHAQDACAPVIDIDSPDPGANLAGPVTFSGWAVDQNATDDSGIGGIQIALDAPVENGGLLLGQAMQVDRPDVDATLDGGSSYGYVLDADLSSLPAGSHTFYVEAMTACGAMYTSVMANVNAGALAAAPPQPSAPVANPVMTPPQTTTMVNSSCNPDFPNFNYNYPSNTACNAASYQNCNPFYPNSNTLYPTNMPCGTTTAIYSGACNPEFPNYNSAYPNNVPCGSSMYTPGANYSACNPFYPNSSTLYPSNVPCSTTATPYYSTNSMTQYYGVCNPTYPVPNATYPSNVPCAGNTSATSTVCAQSVVPVAGAYIYGAPCVGTSSAMPGGVTAAQSGPHAAMITWNGGNGATSYIVSQSMSGPGGPYTAYTTTTTSTSTTVSGLAPGATYYFAVAATSSAGSSAPVPANPVTITY